MSESTIRNTVLPGRVLAPDLARGLMLLVIALAHAPAYLHGRAGDSAPDRVVSGLTTMFVSGRGYPLFALLLGYGLVQLHTRRRAAGYSEAEVRRLLRRRGAGLLVIGLLHALLLWSGDILGAYGVLTLVLAGFVFGMPDRWLLGLAAASVAVVALGGAGGAAAGSASTHTADPLAAAGLRLGEWAPTLVMQPLGLLGGVLLGVWAARREILDEPRRHRTLLRRTAIGGLALAILGGLPRALIDAGVWTGPSEWAGMLAGALHGASGYGGIGYAALIALAVTRIRTPGPVAGALSACGQRSLSCYLAQSVVFVGLLASYGGGLGRHIGVAGAAGVSVAAWASIVGGAAVLRRMGHRGPAEIVLRRWMYR